MALLQVSLLSRFQHSNCVGFPARIAPIGMLDVSRESLFLEITDRFSLTTVLNYYRPISAALLLVRSFFLAGQSCTNISFEGVEK